MGQGEGELKHCRHCALCLGVGPLLIAHIYGPKPSLSHEGENENRHFPHPSHNVTLITASQGTFISHNSHGFRQFLKIPLFPIVNLNNKDEEIRRPDPLPPERECQDTHALLVTGSLEAGPGMQRNVCAHICMHTQDATKTWRINCKQN